MLMMTENFDRLVAMRWKHPSELKRLRGLLPSCPFFLIILLLFLPSIASSDQSDQLNRFKINGFGTLGVVGSDSDQLGFYRNVSQQDGVFKDDLSFTTDSLLGIQLSAEITKKFNAGLQILLKDRVNNDTDFDERVIEQAFVNYRFKPELSLRLGRLPVDTYMLADYRHVGFAYIWARPAVEFYGRVPFTSFDGADVTYAKRMNGGTLKFKLFGGKAGIVLPLATGDPWDSDLDPFIGINATYETVRWSFQATYNLSKQGDGVPSLDQFRQALVAVPTILWPEVTTIIEDLDTKGQEVSYYALGFSFDNNLWLVHSEAAYIDSKLSIQPSEIDAYLSVGRRIGSFTPYIMVAMAEPVDKIREVSSPLVPAFQALQSAAYFSFNTARVDQSTLTAGVKWDLRHNINLKFQWDRSWVEGDGSRLWQSENFDSKNKTIDTLSFNMNFIF
jgi:hypothetical protein